jgi:hypothetical protein
MVTKKDLEVAIAAYGLGRILPAGSTRAAARAAVGAVVRGGRVIAPAAARAAPVVGRGALAAARANPITSAAALGLGLQQAGAFDPIEEAIQARIDDAVDRAMAPIELAQTDIAQQAVRSVAKRKVSKYSKAVKAGMAAVKKSKFGGKPGKISNAKKTFATVNKVASAVNKGKKVATSGIRGVAARAIRRIL